MNLSGVFAPIPTPFDREDRVDTTRLKVAFARWLTRPITGFVVLGSNGEAVLLDEDESDRVIAAARDAVPRGRPFPDMILHLMSVLNIDDPKRVIKIGDAPADLEEGLAAGCRWVVGVTWGTHTRSQLMQDPHTHLVDTVEELTLLLDSALNSPEPA